MGVLVGLLFLAVVAGLIWWAIWQGQAGSMTFESPQQSREIVVNAMHHFSTRGWVTTTQTVDSPTMTFTRTQAPGCGVTVFLFLFGIIPGLLYWIAAKRTLTLSVSSSPSSVPGATVVRVSWSRNGGGRGPSLQFKQLVAPTAPVLGTQTYTPNMLSDSVEELSGGAVSAIEMRRQQAIPVDVPLAPPVAPTPVPSPARSGFCAKCGVERTSVEAAFCGSCGAAFGA